MKIKIALILLATILSSIQTLSQEKYIPQSGDLLFQDLDCGDFCDAIEKVTSGINNKSFSHVGIVHIENNHSYVLEAGGRGVVKTPLDSFMNRSFDKNEQPKVIAGRLKEPYQYVIPAAIIKCVSLLGKKYDDVFDIVNDQYYCSELVYDAFIDSTGKPLFKTEPMTFIDPDTKQTFRAWVNYFKELGVQIPEGKPGLNPGGISRAEIVEIVFRFY